MRRIKGIQVNGEYLSKEQILSHKSQPIAPLEHLSAEHQHELILFLSEFFSEELTMRLQSSGSTGAPKEFLAPKDALIASAKRSCEFFSLQQGQRVLLRLPLNYIAAKMMILRCLYAGLHLTLRSPSSQLFDDSLEGEEFDFSPIVSQQAAKTALVDLCRIRCILLGGGFIPEKLEMTLRQHSGRVYASYGMTETYSHIALRQLNATPPQHSYHPLSGVGLSLDTESRLIINDSLLGIQDLQSTDLAVIHHDSSFSILGRADNIINSGGIKIQAERVEKVFFKQTGMLGVALPYPHPELGECVAMLWEGDSSLSDSLSDICKNNLSAYERPKFIVHSPSSLPRTASQKIDRRACHALLKNILSKKGS